MRMSQMSMHDLLECQGRYHQKAISAEQEMSNRVIKIGDKLAKTPEYRTFTRYSVDHNLRVAILQLIDKHGDHVFRVYTFDQVDASRAKESK